jgi:hypothetical protein
MCDCNLIRGNLYQFQHEGICDNCASQVSQRIVGQYLVDKEDGTHVFRTIQPIYLKCESCNSLIVIVTHHHIENMEISKELKELDLHA